MKVFKNIVDILRIFLSLAIAYLTIWTVATKWFDIYSMLRVLIVYLPALFFLVFKTKYLAGHPKLLLTYKIARVLFIIWLIVLTGATVWRMNYLNSTKAALDKINNAKITMDDVMGINLPPEPNKDLNDSTVAGFDVNNNGIRDDVELAIFKKYPDSAKIRAGMLQYAQALQLELTGVDSEETLKAIMQKRSNAQTCIDNASVATDLTNEKDVIWENSDKKIKEVENYILNTDLRIQEQSTILNKYMTTYKITSDIDCDIDLSTLSN